MTAWFEEQLEVKNGRAIKVGYKELLESFKSPFQEIQVYDTIPFGKMLVHDGVIMLTEFDETHYHEMIVHVAMNVHPRGQRVLVVGGGDGGTLREVLKHPQVETAHICEIDGDVIRLCKTHFPNLAGCYDDPRVEIFVEDAARFIKEKENFYDVIIVDSTDPIGPGEVLFREAFYRDMHRALTDDGIAVTQSESFHYHLPVIRGLAEFSRKIYHLYRYYYTMVPTYPSGVIGFSFCSKKYDPLADFNEERAGTLEGLRYYSSAIHRAAFALPRHVEEALR